MSDALRASLGVKSAVRAYYDQGEENVVAIVEAAGAPSAGLATYATASVHAHRNLLAGDDVRVELLLVGMADEPGLANVLATSAFFVMKNRWLAAPGVVFPSVIADVLPEATTRHVMWVEPFDFETLASLTVPGVEVPIYPLQGVPITDAELCTLRTQGFHALESALRRAATPHYDLSRTSAT